MTRITLNLPDASRLALKLSAEALADEVCLAAAVKFYELGRLSSGAAAELPGIPRALFLSRLADYGVESFRLTEEELRRETRLA
jgi:predicted HTH domain antitoxin